MVKFIKVGIITLFDNTNFGNRLQNYALQQVLLEYADEVTTIKNKPELKGLREKLMRSSFLAESPLLNRIMGKKRKAMHLAFNKKYIRTSPKSYCFERDNPASMERCDYFCAGSDQIWNPELGRAGGFNYMTFAPGDCCFSYAASFGLESIPERDRQAIAAGLRHLRHISVREETGKRIVEDLTGRTDVQVLIDPTMLLTTKQWDQVISRPVHIPEKPYLLTYFLGGISSRRKSEIARVAAENDWQIVDVLDRNSPLHDIGPDQFVYLIKHARLVCTDSFHASVFSFLYGSDLGIFPRIGKNFNMNSRLNTLVCKFGLERCMVTDERILPSHFRQDYACGYVTLEKERSKSRQYLSKVFSKE